MEPVFVGARYNDLIVVSLAWISHSCAKVKVPKRKFFEVHKPHKVYQLLAGYNNIIA